MSEDDIAEATQMMGLLHPGTVTTVEKEPLNAVPEAAKPPVAAVESAGPSSSAAAVPATVPARKTHEPTHKFWDTQPVPKSSQVVDEVIGAVEGPEKVVQKDPIPLPPGFEWFNVNLEDDDEAKAVYDLLSNHYVEDDDSMFRFGYQIDFLRWALHPPGFNRDWHIGVRSTAKKNMLAFITAVPATIRVKDKEIKMVEVNFLCVHKKLRSKRLAPVLITEVTRRVNLTGVFQATYTAGVELPKPVARCRYWHRSLRVKKLIEIGFTSQPKRLSMAGTVKLYDLPEAPTVPGIRALEKKDMKQALALLSSELATFGIAQVFDIHEFAYYFTPREGIVYTFVREVGGKITDLISFYNLPSLVLRHPVHTVLNAAYSFHNVARSIPKEELIHNALILAKNTGHDVFNMLDLQNNGPVFEPLKFGKGDGCLHYYFYNYFTPTLEPKDVGLVLF